MPLISRFPKETGLDTIHYEILMLRFCAQRLAAHEQDHCLRFVVLEGFLLHYRNLVRVFSGIRHHDDDISTHVPETWAGRALTAAEIASIQVPAKALDATWHQLVSKYLQHCTTLRHTTPQGWDVAAMRAGLEPVIEAFERSWPSALQLS